MYKYTSHTINKFEALIISTFLAMLSSALAFFGIFGKSNDYNLYLSYFEYNISRASCFDENIFNFDIGFDVTSCLATSFVQSPNLAYTFLILISVFAKSTVIYITLLATKSTNLNFIISYFLCFLVYFSRFFPLHELTQIRASLSIVFLLVASLLLYQEKSRIKASSITVLSLIDPLPLLQSKSSKRISDLNLWALFLYFIACLFHSSILLVLPVVIVAFYVKDRKNLLIVSIIMFIILKIFFSQYVFKFLIGFNPRLFDYIDNENYSSISTFSPKRILDFYLVVIGVIYSDVNNRCQLFYMSLVAFSIVCFYSLVDIPVVAYRLSEVVQVFSIPLIATMRSDIEIILVIPYVIAIFCICIHTFFYTGEFFSSW
jgi:EpsG family